MKKTLSVLACSVLLFSTCNKDEKLNRSLDGTWISTSINGAPGNGNAVKYEFSQSGKNEGKIKITYFDSISLDDTYTGTYKITNDGKTVTMDATESLNNGNSSAPNSKLHLVDVISNKERTKFTATESYEEIASGITGTDVYTFEKQ